MNYLFYRSLDLLRLTGSFDLKFGASGFLTLLLTWDAYFVFQLFFDPEYVKNIQVMVLIVYSGLYLIFYVYYVRLKKSQQAIDEYENESQLSKVFGRFLILALFLGPVLYYFSL